MIEVNKIYNECCLETMGRMEENSVDTIITDPPYGLRFMGKKWDYDVPGVNIWRECLRVLKPGGTALIFAGSRTQHRMAVNVEDAGFILKDCIMWIYGSGFPKAADISKQLDKGHEREVVGEADRYKDGRKRKNTEDYKNNVKVGANANGSALITKAATPEAQLWNGWKSHGLKPAYEPILVCMKPNEGSYAENALKWGVSGLNINGARVDGKEPHHNYGRTSGESSFVGKSETPSNTPHNGRFPANLILDEESARMLDEQSGELKNGAVNMTKTSSGLNSIYGRFTRNENSKVGSRVVDSGGASRFFYCAKASRSERNRGCGDLPLRDGSYGKNLSSSDKGTISGSKHPVRNNHPTVKPLDLMEYLCKLTKTPTGGVVYDPFIGSGTTAMACINTGRDFIGSEAEVENCEIANKRIKKANEQGQFFI